MGMNYNRVIPWWYLSRQAATIFNRSRMLTTKTHLLPNGII
jgi:hypothetical protein